MARKRLTLNQKRLAARSARAAWAACGGDKAKFEALVKEDGQKVGIDPMLILLFVRIAMAVYDYFKNRNASTDVADSDDDLILNSVRYLKD